MPLILTVPGKDLYDPAANRFIITSDKVLTLEHSLLSIARWESKWHKPYLSQDEKTREELIDYIRCMTLTQNVAPEVYLSMDNRTLKKVIDYIQDANTATTIKRLKNAKRSHEIVTNEIVYYWMTALNIPFEPCEKWHFNHLMTLIEVCSIKQEPPKKMSKAESARRRSALNQARRAKYGSHG